MVVGIHTNLGNKGGVKSGSREGGRMKDDSGYCREGGKGAERVVFSISRVVEVF